MSLMKLYSADHRIAFRVDASNLIGTGHLMRCLALAEELQSCGIIIFFVCRNLPDYLCTIIQSRGFQILKLKDRKQQNKLDCLQEKFLTVDQKTDAEDTIALISSHNLKWLIVDHYGIDHSWECMLRPYTEKILVIDDLANRHHECDILINQNIGFDFGECYSSKVPSEAVLLLGARYALLRREFIKYRNKIKCYKDNVSKILVFFGGIDSRNYTGTVISILDDMALHEILVDVVIGTNHPCRKQIEEFCSRRKNFCCYVQTDKMAELMASADVSIGAGGITTWERCCVGLPAVVVCAADNQEKQLEFAAEQGAIYYPVSSDILSSKLQHHLISLIENPFLRQSISVRGRQLVDGLGVKRVVREIQGFSVSVRLGMLTDSDKILEWRNHSEVRLASRNKTELLTQSHLEWMESIINDPNIILLVGEIQGVPFGVVRFNINGGESEVSIFVNMERNTTGSGKQLLYAAEKWLSVMRKDVLVVKAEVLASNEKSNKMFLDAGYNLMSSKYYKKLVH